MDAIVYVFITLISALIVWVIHVERRLTRIESKIERVCKDINNITTKIEKQFLMQ